MNRQSVVETVWTAVARIQDLPLREGRIVIYGNLEIAVFNLGDRVLAVDSRCPHKAGPLADGILSGTTIVCPLHAWKFSLESGEAANALSAGNCIKTFRTRIQGDIVLIEVPARLSGPLMPGTFNVDSDYKRAEGAK